uniref:Uncharacterized protein n=1 Tax=Rhizophora mucronata TaxID=61149 RepID=A0A2P2N3G3_RHIMU
MWHLRDRGLHFW